MTCLLLAATFAKSIDAREISRADSSRSNTLIPLADDLLDIMATCVEVGGATYPDEFRGRPNLPLAGRSLLPALENKPDAPRAPIFEHERNAAPRQGDWKLVGQDVVKGEGLRADARWELYNLSRDPSEQHDLASVETERTARMSREFLDEARRTLDLPAP